MANKLLSDDEVFGAPQGKTLLSDDEVFGAPAREPAGSGYLNSFLQNVGSLGPMLMKGVAAPMAGVERQRRAMADENLSFYRDNPDLRGASESTILERIYSRPNAKEILDRLPAEAKGYGRETLRSVYSGAMEALRTGEPARLVEAGATPEELTGAANPFTGALRLNEAATGATEKMAHDLPIGEETTGKKIAGMAGSIGPVLGAGVLSGGLTVPAALGGLMGAGEMVQRGEAAGQSFDDPRVLKAAGEYAPVAAAMQAIPVGPLLKPAGPGIAGAAKRLLAEAGIVGAMGAGQTAAGNLIEGAEFNPEKPAMEGVVESGGSGLAVGAIMALLLGRPAPKTRIEKNAARKEGAPTTELRTWGDIQKAAANGDKIATALIEHPAIQAFEKNGLLTPDLDVKKVQRIIDRAEEGGTPGIPEPQDSVELARQRAEAAAIAAGEMHPAAASTFGRQPIKTPEVIQGGYEAAGIPGRAVDPSVQVGYDLRGTPARSRALVPLERQPTRMTPEQVAQAQAIAANEARNATVPADTIVVPPDRRPQTRDQAYEQSQAEQAFRQAQAQRERSAGSADTQPGGRPEGFAAKSVYLDGEHPVQVVRTENIPDARGRATTVAIVRRYDPRTGDFLPDSIEYPVPMRGLRQADYANAPRQAQDFRQRAKGPKPASPLPEQTYRTTQGDADTTYPGATSGEPGGQRRQPFPEQPEGAGGRPWSNAEDIQRGWQERAQERARAEAERQRASPGAKYAGAKFSSKAKVGPDGFYPVDEYGHVLSDAGTPIHFPYRGKGAGAKATEKKARMAAARWIIDVGQKTAPGQAFDLGNHPGAEGFTIVQTGRKSAGPDATGPDAGPGNVRVLSGPKAKATPRADNVVEPPQTVQTVESAPDLAPKAEAAPVAESASPGPIRPKPSRREAAPKQPKTLLQFLHGIGGLDINSQMASDLTQLGGRRKGQFGKGIGSLFRKGGRSLDDAREAAVEAGYLRDHNDPNRPSESTINDLLDAIDREVSGDPVYSSYDAEAADNYRYGNRVERENEAYLEKLRRRIDEFDKMTQAQEDGEVLSPGDQAFYEREALDKDAVQAEWERLNDEGATGRNQGSQRPEERIPFGDGKESPGTARNSVQNEMGTERVSGVEGATEQGVIPGGAKDNGLSKLKNDRNRKITPTKNQKAKAGGMFGEEPAPRAEHTDQEIPFRRTDDNPRVVIETADGARLEALDDQGTIFGIALEPAKAEAAAAALNKRGRELFGQSYRDIEVRKVLTDDKGVEVKGGVLPDDGGVGRLIALALTIKNKAVTSADLLKTLVHEGMHTLRINGIVSPVHEAVALKIAQRIPELKSFIDQYKPGERGGEALSELVARWWGGDAKTRSALTGTIISKLFRKIDAYLRDAVGWWNGQDRTHKFGETLDDVLRKLDRGEYANSRAKAESGDRAMFQRAGDESPVDAAIKRFGRKDDAVEVGREMAEADTPSKGAVALGRFGKWLQRTDGERLSDMAGATKNAGMDYLSKQFSSEPGLGRGVAERDYMLAKDIRQNAEMNKVEEALSELPKGGTEADWARVGELNENPRLIDPSKGGVHKAADMLRKQLKDVLAYMRESGVDVGEVKDGYWPHPINEDKLIADPKGAGETLVKAYMEQMRADGQTPNLAVARRAAADLQASFLARANGLDPSGADFTMPIIGQAKPAHTKERTFTSKRAQQIMIDGGLYDRNPAVIMQRYIAQGVRRAEWAKRMGPITKADRSNPLFAEYLKSVGEQAKADRRNPAAAIEEAAAAQNAKWQAVKHSARSEGHDYYAGQAAEILKRMTGVGNASKFNPAMSMAQTMGMMATLGHSVVSSIQDPHMIAVRTGKPADFLRAYIRTLENVVSNLGEAMGATRAGKALGIRGIKRVEEQRRWVQRAGLLANDLTNTVMMSRYTQDMGGKAREWLNNYFKMTGLHGWTENARLAAAKIGHHYLAHLAEESNAGSKMAALALEELGVARADQPQFAKDMQAHAQQITIDPNSEFGRKYVTALGIFDRGSILQSNPAQRPGYLNTPLGRTIFMLQGYNMAFAHQVLGRQMRNATAKGLSGSEKFKALAGPMAMLAMTYPLQRVLVDLRKILWPSSTPDEQTEGDKWLTSVSRANGFGRWDMLFNMLYGMKYNKSFKELPVGPGLGIPLEIADATKGMFVGNSENTNTADRKFYNTMWKDILVPGVATLVSAAYPNVGLAGRLAGAAAIQTVTHPTVREKVLVEPMAGPAEERKQPGGSVGETRGVRAMRERSKRKVRD